MYNGDVFTRSLKPLPNKYVRDKLAHWSKKYPEYIFDGELITPSIEFSAQTSAFMNHQGMPEFRYYTFDYIKNEQFDEPFIERITNAPLAAFTNDICALKHIHCLQQADVEYTLNSYLTRGHEGAIVRHISSPYKFGRSTRREGFMLKLKPFVDSEAKIVKINQQFHNGNPAGVSQIGLTERSTSQDLLIPVEMAGSIEVEDERMFPGVTFCVSGFTQEMKETLWQDKDNYIGRLIKYKFQNYGIKDRPRSAQFLGFRDKDDL